MASWRMINQIKPASWSIDNALFQGAGVWGSNLGPVKSDKELPKTCHRCNISWKRASKSFPGAMTQIWALQTRDRIRRNTSGIIKDLI